MEHLFDSLSKDLAQVSRRQAIGTFLRGAVGAFLVSAGFVGRSLRGQSAACTACGTCYKQNPTTGKMEACKDRCEARALCNTAQSYNPYAELAAMLPNINGLQPTSYSALISVNGTSETTIFQTNYLTSPNSLGVTNTAQLFMVSSPSGQAAYA